MVIRYVYRCIREEWIVKRLMVFLLLVVMVSLAGCSSGEEVRSETRTIVDMAGREVEIPLEVNSVYSTGPIGTIFIYTLEPDKLAGWNYKLGDDREYIKSEYYDLPILGRFSAGSSNVEEILKVNPDLIINMGDVNEKYIAESDDIQSQLGIPVVMVDGSLEKQGDSYRFLGEIFGVSERAAELAVYSESVFADIVAKEKDIANRVTVYYATGPKGLETAPAGSINTELLDLVGGINIADSGTAQDVRRMDVSLEQVLFWNPEYIIIGYDGDPHHEVYNTIKSDSKWQSIEAVKAGYVYEIPYAPYDWFNRPPSVMRILGVQWLGNLLYPDIYILDIEQETKEFFRLFFDYELTDEKLNEILERSKK